MLGKISDNEDCREAARVLLRHVQPKMRSDNPTALEYAAYSVIAMVVSEVEFQHPNKAKR